MHTKKKKIGFYYIVLEGNTNNASSIEVEINNVLSHISGLNPASKKYDLHSLKFCVLENNYTSNDVQKLIFESATHSYRAPLMDRRTVSKRDNPKTLNEGETIKTHAVIRYVDGDAILISEKTRGGLASQEIVRYLNYFKAEYDHINDKPLDCKFGYQVIAKDNIQEELDNMDRVVGASLYVDKRILGSDALNFTDRGTSLKQDIIIEVKSQRLADMKNAAQDFLHTYLMGESTEIHKLRIVGKNSRNNTVTLDTSFMEKREYVTATLDEDTGEVDSNSMFIEMLAVIERE